MISRLSLTGHRPDKLGGYSEDVYGRLLRLALDWFEENSPQLVNTGMALGWDTAGAEAAYLLGIPFIAYVPFAGQEDSWRPASRKLYRNLLDKADDVIYVCEPGFAAWKMLKRNEAMMDNCDAVLAMWNGDKTGGTAHAVQYALSKKATIYNLWESFQASN